MLVGALVAIVIVAYGGWRLSQGSHAELGTATANTDRAMDRARPERDHDSVNLSDLQLASVKVEPVEEHPFPVAKEFVGSIDFNEELAVQVFTPYQGRIIALYASIGDDVKKGQTLFTIDSPDLLQAEVHPDRRGGRFGADHA